MFISAYGRSIKLIFVSLILISIMLISCKDARTQLNENQQNLGETERSDNAFSVAVEQVEKDNPEGLLKLYEIASENNSAEMSEIARDQLHHFLYFKPELWIRTFSRTDLESFKKYLKFGGMAVLELPTGVASEEQYDREIVTKLNNFRGNDREMELRNYILGLYEQY